MNNNLINYFIWMLSIMFIGGCLMSCEKPQLNEEIIEEVEETFWFDGLDGKKPMTFVDKLVELADNKGIDLSYVYDFPIEFKFEDNNGWAGTAHARDNDELISITIDPIVFDRMAPLHIWTLYFHELGHDVLNYAHLDGHSIDGIHIMNQAGNREILDADQLLKEINAMLDHFKNKVD